MKPFAQLVTIAAFATLSLSVHAQTDPTWRNDPTYSTHNYKHANKAAAARRRVVEPGVPVNFPKPGAARFANYKMPAINQAPVGGVVLPHTPSTDLAERNYKMPRPLRQDSPAKPATAEKTTAPASSISE